MSECSRLLDPIFREIGVLSARKSHLSRNSDAWERLDDQSKMLYGDANRIFLQYNPEFRKEKDNVTENEKRVNEKNTGDSEFDTEKEIMDGVSPGT